MFLGRFLVISRCLRLPDRLGEAHHAVLRRADRGLTFLLPPIPEPVAERFAMLGDFRCAAGICAFPVVPREGSPKLAFLMNTPMGSPPITRRAQPGVPLRNQAFHVGALGEIGPEVRMGEVTDQKNASGDSNNLKRGHVDAIARNGRPW